MPTLRALLVLISLHLAPQAFGQEVITLSSGLQCGMEGSATSHAGKALNRLKNRYHHPASADIDPEVTLEALLAPGDDLERFDQGMAAKITGLVVAVKVGGNETCNCKATAAIDRDTHIELALSPDAEKTQRVIVEITPRLRKQMADQGVDWSTQKLKDPESGIRGKWVQVTGWLMFDQMHVHEAENTNPGGEHNWRATAWELHPVTGIEVTNTPLDEFRALGPRLLTRLHRAYAIGMKRDLAGSSVLRERNKNIVSRFDKHELDEDLPSDESGHPMRFEIVTTAPRTSPLVQPPMERARSIRIELDGLENRFHSANRIAEFEDPRSVIDAARTYARSVGGNDDAAFVRAFHTATRSTPGRALGGRLLLRPFAFESPLLDLHAAAKGSLFSDPKFLANAKKLIQSPHVHQYPGGNSLRIVGGFADEADLFPDCVAVGSVEDGYCCTGTLIAPNIVVTAGHCYPCCNERRGGQIHIGKKAYGPGRTIRVKKAVQHPAYGVGGLHNDLTILLLEEQATEVVPRKLASPEKIDAATFIKAVGFGNTNFGGTDGYGTRRLANVPIASNLCDGAGLHDRYGCDTGYELVAGGIGLDVDTCTGDSGGPIYIEQEPGSWYLAGVTSRMTKEAIRICADGGIYARIDKYAEWMKPFLAGNGVSGIPSVPGDKNQQPGRASPSTNRYVVYVHGICHHVSGYSDLWWSAMQPHVSSAVPEGNRREVLWSDLVNSERARLVRRERNAAHDEARDRILEILKDRAVRQRLDAAGDERGLPEGGERELNRDIPYVSCIDDFTVYLLNDEIRQEAKNRLLAVVRPLLVSGAEVEVISHSWGTVIAYEALRSLDRETTPFAGKIRHFFTVGSALSIGEVKRRLEPNCRDGQRPRFVQHWANLNARFDIVGGHLKGNPFAVDDEYLSLRAVGCSPFLPSPPCAHSSYFQRENLAVNRDIFGRLIGN